MRWQDVFQVDDDIERVPIDYVKHARGWKERRHVDRNVTAH